MNSVYLADMYIEQDGHEYLLSNLIDECESGNWWEVIDESNELDLIYVPN